MTCPAAWPQPTIRNATAAPAAASATFDLIHGWPIWRAWDDAMGADASPYGAGETEQAARDDLARQLDDMEDEG